MKKIDLGQTATVLANLAVLVGIVFLAFELRQLTIQTQLDAIEVFTNRENELDRMIIEFPELYLAIIKQIECPPMRTGQFNSVLTQHERASVTRYNEMRFMSWQASFDQFRSSALSERFLPTLSSRVESVLRLDPILARTWQVQRDSYDPEFVEFMNTLYEQTADARDDLIERRTSAAGNCEDATDRE